MFLWFRGSLAEEFLQKNMDPRKGTDTTFGIRYVSGKAYDR